MSAPAFLDAAEIARRLSPGAAVDALDALIGQDRAEVLDCSCGIGTQAIGLALRGHRVTGTDLSFRAAARASVRSPVGA